VDYVLTGKRSKAHVMAKPATAGERVRQVRDEMAMSVEEFAAHLEQAPDVVALAEAGETSQLNKLLSPLADKCTISPMWLLSGVLPVLEGDLSPFEVFVIDRYRSLGPAQRLALRDHAAALFAQVETMTPKTKESPRKSA
jgi:hypothetical protein